MSHPGPLPVRSSESWQYALIGGLSSIPFTIALYWLSGLGQELSLNMVVVGGLLTGYLAKRGGANVDRAGFRAGLIGAVPALWLLFDGLRAAVEVPGTGPFRIGAVTLSILIALFVFAVGGIAGLIGAKIGGWLAKKTGHRRAPLAGV